jgi:hypothetical protein
MKHPRTPIRPPSFAAALIEELREVAYKQDWSGSALDTVVGIVRKVERRKRLAESRTRRARADRRRTK